VGNVPVNNESYTRCLPTLVRIPSPVQDTDHLLANIGDTAHVKMTSLSGSISE
jgi:hypothetical protein